MSKVTVVAMLDEDMDTSLVVFDGEIDANQAEKMAADILVARFHEAPYFMETAAVANLMLNASVEVQVHEVHEVVK